MRRLKVVLADDHRLMLRSIRLVLEADGGFEIVGEADAGTKVIPCIRQTGPDLVLLDLRMPGMDGLEVLEQIRDRYPQVRVVILSAVTDPSVIRAAFERGATAFVLKHINPRDLASALRQANSDSVFQPLALLDRASNGAGDDVALTERESKILQELQRGRSNRQIAETLFLAEQTVKFHLTNVYRKLGVSNRTEAVRYAYEHGIGERPLVHIA